MTKAHIVQHTHWDREWYFTAEDAKVLSDQVFTEVLDELTNNPHANFCLDGQSSIVDEYVEINPEKLPVIQKLVAEERLFIGPWYAQTDALLVDAESILRNLIIGIHDTAAKYGKPMMVGYLPDTFGFNAQLPTLLNQVGIDNFMCWRGLNFEKLVPSPYFIWKGLGERSVYAMNFPFGYMTGLMTIEAQKNISTFVKEKLDPAIGFLQDHGDNSTILIPSGIDQKNMVRNLEKIVPQINEASKFETVISDYPAYVEQIRQKQNLPSYQGELREPVYSRVHRSIGSVRSQMKLDNFQLEQRILRRIEPLMVIAQKNDIQVSNGLLKRLWKKTMENQAHDSIGGCISDNVAEDIIHRTKEAYEIAAGLENLIAKRLADSLELTPQQVLIFNTDPVPFSGEKIVHIVSRTKNIRFKDSEKAVLINEKYYPERHNIQRLVATGFEYISEPTYYELDIAIDVTIPGLGYTVVEFIEGDKTLEAATITEETSITNDLYTLAFEAGKVTLTTKTGREIHDFIRLVDSGNNGDTYDFSPLADEVEKALQFEKAHVEKDSSKQSLIIEGLADLPYDLDDRMAENPKTKPVAFQVTLNLKADALIEGEITLDNQVLSHRVRLQLQVDDLSGTTVAQIQNGFVTNKPDPVPADWQEKYVEKPVDLHIFEKSLSVEYAGSTLTAFADGLREYERIDDKLLITLFATTGQLGKPDLAWRPGRASGDTTNEGHIMMPTPLAQEIGERKFTFAVEIVEGTLDQHAIAKTAIARLTPSISYQKQELNKFINRLDNKIWPLQYPAKPQATFSLLEITDQMLVSAIYPAYSEVGSYVVRLANPTDEPMKLPEELLQKGRVVNALEQEITMQSEIAPFDYVTLLIK